MMRCATAVVTTAVSLFGCGNNQAAPDAAPDAPPCLVPSDLGTLDAFARTSAVRVVDGAGKESVNWVGARDFGAAADVLDVQLLEGKGAFAAGPPTTGTFGLTGVEAQLATCGVCVVLKVGSPREHLVAQSGMLVIDELGPSLTGRFRASLSDTMFARVVIDPVTFESTVLDDGCTTTITAASWDTPID